MAFATEYGFGFGILDLTTGGFTSLGNSGVGLGGLAALDGTLYGFSNSNGTLYTVNTTNGSVTAVGGSGSFNLFGGTTTGLYAVGLDGNLYSINPSTGTNTLIGSTGLANNGELQSLSDDDGTLYLSRFYSGQNILYSVNTNTGVATEVGVTGVSDILGMEFEGGTLFGVNYDGSAGNVVTINPITGTATTGSAITPSGTSVIYLAPDPLTSAVTPEPASLGLSAMLLVALAILSWIRRSSGLRSPGQTLLSETFWQKPSVP
jgi:hypothetical protein